MTNKRIRKTKDIIVIQGNYGRGWEDVTAENDYWQANMRLKEYNENEPQFPHRRIVRREKIKSVS